MMVAVIIKKRLFLMVILGLAGFILLFLGLRGGFGLEIPSLPGVKVITPNTGNVSIEGSEKTAVLDGLLSNKGSESGTARNQDFFIDYRLERDRTRGQQVEWLREVINNAGTADETRQKAQEHLMSISRSMEKESELENLIRAKGFADAAIMLDETTATAIVSAGTLSSVEAAAITELISRSTGMEQQKIAVINKN
jgi:stage III sporulation protein AH